MYYPGPGMTGVLRRVPFSGGKYLNTNTYKFLHSLDLAILPINLMVYKQAKFHENLIPILRVECLRVYYHLPDYVFM